MSEQNVERVRAALDAYSRGDLDSALADVDPGVEWRSAIIGVAEGNVYVGHEGYRRWYAESLEAFEQLTTEATEFRDLGDRVVMLGGIKAIGRESGVRVDSETGWLFTFRNGKIVKGEGFLSHAQALEAAGLSP